MIENYGYWIFLLIIELVFVTIMVCMCMENSKIGFHLKQNKLIYFVSVILLAPIAVYIIRFHDYECSLSPADWGVFGDYIGGVYSVVLTIVLVYVTYTINKKNDEDKERKKVIKKLYAMIVGIDSDSAEIESINKIIRYIDVNNIHFSNDVCRKLINEMDYYICAVNDRSKIDINREMRIKDYVKNMYNGC